MDRRAVPPGILKDIRRLISELEKENIRVQKVILFGSHARGAATSDSDIDVALVSPDFYGIRFLDRERLNKIILRINYLIETHPYTPEDFEASPFVRDEILAHGIEISLSA